jgi:hypothetical protein
VSDAAAKAPAGASPVEAGLGRGKRWRRIVGSLIGLALLMAAAWVIYSQREQMEDAWASARHAPWWLLGLALLLPLVNWLLISLSFWIMMRRHGRIGLGEMCAAIGAAWLLNYLPLRAGMVGRVAYHRAVNRIAIADSVRVMVLNLAIGGMAVLAMLAIALGMGAEDSLRLWGMVLSGPALVAAAATALAAKSGGAWWLPAVFLLRYLDMLAWTARYAVVFTIVGSPIGLAGAVAIAAACQLALVVPFIGNGMGVREWAVGLTAAALPASLVSGGGMIAAVGLAADLANRAAEVVAAVVVGQVSLLAIGRRLRASRERSPAAG